MNVKTLFATLAFVPALAWAQNDDAASAQHLILGQQASASTQLESRTNTHPDAQWFPKAGFGLFVHIGMSAVHGGIDLSWGMLKNKSWEDGELCPVDYWKMADRWNPVNFKPEVWAKQAKEAGFRYVVFITKHHDGYTMWPSKYSDFGVEQKMGGRDLVKEVVEACRKNGLKIGLYFSPIDWHFDRNYMSFGNENGKYYNQYYELVDKLPAKPADTTRHASKWFATK